MKGITVHEISEPGFHPVVDFEAWRVAIFNDADQWKAENLTYLQKHDLSDEVFVLLEGQCTLILFDENISSKIYGVRMEKGKVYNIRKGVWHTHILEARTKLIVVENSNTTPDNSPKVPLPYPVDLESLEYLNY